MPAEACCAMVGREDELRRLDGLVRQVAQGRAGLVWVQGEAGIGKSALVDAVAARASQAGCSVLRGAGDELEQAFPLRLMADALAVSPRSPDEYRARIARLLCGEANGPGVVDPVLAAGERLLELVDRLCTDRPLVLVTEDLHWADEASLLLWNRLARALNQIPLLLVGTSRPVPCRATVARLRELVGERHGEVVDLGPLDHADVDRIAGTVLDAAPGPRLSGELARAGGNPLYALELLDALMHDGLVEVGDGMAEFTGEPGATPDSLSVVLGRRLRYPQADTADVLQIAALLGNDFDLSELAVVSGRSAAELSPVVEEAVAAGVVRAAGPRLLFRHELIRQVLVDQLSTATRAGLHSDFARALAAAGLGVEVVARHVLAGPEAADHWVLRWLAEVPEPMLYAAPQVAAELLTRAMRSVAAEDPWWELLAARMAQVLFWLGRDEEARRLAQELVRRTSDATVAARMNTIVLRSAGRCGRPEEALAVATQPVDERLPLRCQATVRAWSTAILAASGKADLARAAATATLDLAARSGDRLALGYALHAATLVGDAPSALTHIDEALAGLGDDPESMDLRMLLVNNRLTYLAALGRWDEVEAALSPALALAEQAGTARAAWLQATAAEVCYMRGAWDDALVYLHGIDAELDGNTANLNQPALAALIALHRGEREEAEAHLRAAGVDEPSTAQPPRSPANWRLTAALALHAEAAGDPRRAVALMSTWLDPVLIPNQRTRQEMMPHLVRVALCIDDRDTAAAATATCRADTDMDGQAEWAVAGRCCQAQLDDDAESLLDAADDYRRSGWPLQIALALEEAAVRLAAAGEVKRARRAFTDALNAYWVLGASWDLRRTEARLRPYGIRRGPRSLHRRAASGWQSLTPAETRIVELVARGMSNPDIATELFLSRRTVQTHVSNVLAKLGLSSRVEIVREANGGTPADGAA
jgi:DNA-binding CsgD family transcriptional regulator/tetratricopeptide (TPR) repeat protein